MTFRSKAFEIAQGRVSPVLTPPTEKVADLYGSNTFSDDVMKTLLSA